MKRLFLLSVLTFICCAACFAGCANDKNGNSDKSAPDKNYEVIQSERTVTDCDDCNDPDCNKDDCDDSDCGKGECGNGNCERRDGEDGQNDNDDKEETPRPPHRANREPRRGHNRRPCPNPRPMPRHP